ncbi:uncharacterized protein LOC115895167 isoform X2 [Rhinopithecus roxellana]|uniref:uncharacterized protein LOC115895167 isoform X2 n=1 Tax=Rhinopithecus roxellana TaxID=61622 RepID=UPI00123788E6|nr:uncharacterized protein LOC115895167 isoform X2 [Rhinopithecus roxellana]
MPCDSGGAAGGAGRRGSSGRVSVRSCRQRLLLIVLVLWGPGVVGRARPWKRRRLPFICLSPRRSCLLVLRCGLRRNRNDRPLPPPSAAASTSSSSSSSSSASSSAPGEAGCRRRPVRAATRASLGGGAWPCRVGEGNEPQSPGVSAEQRRRRRHQVSAELE